MVQTVGKRRIRHLVTLCPQGEGEAAGYTVSSGGKQRVLYAGAQLALSFYSVTKSSS